MAVSSNTLFHFTDSAENLIGILENDFLPRFCLEELELFRKSGAPLLDMAIPMVCFCDLPLSNLGEQLSAYGNYGIGMSKEWGIRQGINPVLYLTPNSDFHKILMNLCKYAIMAKEDPPRLSVLEFFSFVKPVEGKMFRRGKFVEKYFYDEREWRYVPTLVKNFSKKEMEAEYRLSREEFLDKVKRAYANRELGERAKLTFEPTDIRYIIVSDESEIVSMIRAVRDIKQRFDAKTVDLLSSRIISAKQITEDF